MTVEHPPAEPGITGAEIRSIDYVPPSERHGRPWHLGPLWFMANAQLATLAVGLAGVTSGGNLAWSLIAIVVGCLFGTFFMAFHSAQGPQLGLPQMIQSRPQFGYVGAILVWLFAYLQYAGFNVFNTILAGQAMQNTTGIAERPWFWLVTVLALIVALIGYDYIHRVQRLLTYTFVVVYGVFTVGVIATLHLPPGAFDLGGFRATPFLLQFGVAAGYQISWAIYVSDYSRYLPATVTVRQTLLWTYGGSAVGAIWLMGLGAYLAAAAGRGFDTIGTLAGAADGVFRGLGPAILVFSALGLMSVTALNVYGGSLTLLSAVDSVRRVRPTLAVRTVAVVITALISLVLAMFASTGFLANFENFLLLVLYLFVPWTAVNLVDYYLVRRGHYAIAEIFKPRGLYGRWGWRGIVAYLVGFAAMVPFFSTGLFTGPLARAFGGTDLSLFVGLPVAGGLYYLFARSLDVAAEAAVAEAEFAGLDDPARSPGTPAGDRSPR